MKPKMRDWKLGLVFAGLLVVGIVWAEEQTLEYTYDGADRLVVVSYDDTGAILYRYDASGNRTRRIAVGPDNPEADYDTNGLYDVWEIYHLRDIGNDPNADLDGDGYDNRDESLSWTDPTNAASHLQFLVDTNDGGAVTIAWEADSRATYRVWWATNIEQWITGHSITTSEGSWTDPNTTNTYRYYRVTVEDN